MVDQSHQSILTPTLVRDPIEDLRVGDAVARYFPQDGVHDIQAGMIATITPDEITMRVGDMVFVCNPDVGTWWLLERPAPTYERGSVGTITVRGESGARYHAMYVWPDPLDTTADGPFWISDFGTKVAPEAVVSFEPDPPALPRDVVAAFRGVPNVVALPADLDRLSPLLAALSAHLPAEDASS